MERKLRKRKRMILPSAGKEEVKKKAKNQVK